MCRWMGLQQLLSKINTITSYWLGSFFTISCPIINKLKAWPNPQNPKTSEDGSRSLSPLFPLSPLGFCENFFEIAGPGVWSHVQVSKCDWFLRMEYYCWVYCLVRWDCRAWCRLAGISKAARRVEIGDNIDSLTLNCSLIIGHCCLFLCAWTQYHI
jgi:hypothetical protein